MLRGSSTALKFMEKGTIFLARQKERTYLSRGNLWWDQSRQLSSDDERHGR